MLFCCVVWELAWNDVAIIKHHTFHIFSPMYSTEDTPDKLMKSLPPSRCGFRWCLSSHCSCKLESAWVFLGDQYFGELHGYHAPGQGNERQWGKDLPFLFYFFASFLWNLVIFPALKGLRRGSRTCHHQHLLQTLQQNALLLICYTLWIQPYLLRKCLWYHD